MTKNTSRIKIVSVTEGRDGFGNHLIGIKNGTFDLIGIERYNRVLGAFASLEAVKMLAGKGDEIDEPTRECLRQSARELLATLEI